MGQGMQAEACTSSPKMAGHSFGSASYRALSHLRTHDTPVADTLAHSPPLSLAIDYVRDVSAEDEADVEGTILAFKQRDRVRYARLYVPATILQKFIVTIDVEYPILEYPVTRSASLHCDEGYNDNMICVIQTMHSKIRIADNTVTDGKNMLWNVTFVVVSFSIET